jgi:hypothetical protein
MNLKLNFNEHISNIWKKASRQLNVLKENWTSLNQIGKTDCIPYF